MRMFYVTHLVAILSRLLLFCSLAFTICVHSTNAAARKNVLLVIVDDLRPALSCYDDSLAVTPNIDRIAERSVLFRRAYAQQSLCAPSRNSMLTSRRPDTLHLYDTHSYWRKTVGNYTTIPQYFRGHGYQTYSIGKVFHPGASSNFSDDYPLSWSQPTFHPSTEAHTNEAVCSDAHDTAYRRNLVCPVHVRWQPGRTLPDIQSVAEAERLIAAAKQNGAPYFIAIGLHKPHIPYRYPAHFRRYHAIEKFQWADSEHIRYGMPTVAFNPFNDLRKRDDVRQLNVSFPFGPIDKHFAWKIRQSYYASVTYVDDLIGRLLAGVSLSDTIVVLTGDHGYSLGEHAEWAKYTNYEVGVRVPLIVYSPAFDRRPPLARRSSRIAELVDVFPTLVDLAELPAIERCAALAPSARQTCTEGKSLTPSIWRGSDANDASDEFAISQYPRPGSYPTQWPDSDQPRLGDITIMGYSIRTDNFRYTIWLAFSPESFVRDWSRHFGEELYDHRIDGHELSNLADRNELLPLKLALRQLLRDKLEHL